MFAFNSTYSINKRIKNPFCTRHKKEKKTLKNIHKLSLWSGTVLGPCRHFISNFHIYFQYILDLKHHVHFKRFLNYLHIFYTMFAVFLFCKICTLFSECHTFLMYKKTKIIILLTMFLIKSPKIMNMAQQKIILKCFHFKKIFSNR